MKLCLGTVQFGLDYGLHGKHKPAREDAVGLLNLAIGQGIDAFDTSALYGDAEDVVGAFLAQSPIPREKLLVASKFGTDGFDNLSPSACEELVMNRASESLARIGTTYLDAFICHVPTAVYDERIIQAMASLKKSAIARLVGFSVYETAEAETAIKSGAVDLLQIPFSILDQRMANDGILDLASRHGVTLHSRSAYLQGVALMDADEIPEHLAGLRPAIARLEQLCKDAAIARRDLSLAFVRRFPQISHLVFGVHNQKQLAETVASFSADVPADVIQEARQAFSDIPHELVMPNKWKKQ